MASGGEVGPARGRSAQAEIDRLAESSIYMFDLPAWWKSALAAVAASFLVGLFFYPFERWLVDWPLRSLVFFAAPALIAGAFTHYYLRVIGAKTYLERTYLLAMVNVFILGIILVPGKLVEVYMGMHWVPILLLAYSVLALINHLGLLMTATPHGLLALPATLAQPVAGFVPVLYDYYNWSSSGIFVGWEVPVLGIIFIVTYLVAGAVALYIGTRPIYFTYGVTGVDLFRAFLDHWAEGGDSGRADIERFFRIFAEPTHAHVTVLKLRERGGGDPIASLVTPSIHPGPWGEIGASDLPRRLSERLGGEHGEVMTFHGASNHDLNPITHEETDRVMGSAGRALSSLEGFTSLASPFVRRSGDFDACAQAFGDAVVAVHTSAPEPTDDLDGPTGFAVERRLAEAGADPPMFIDSHNCLSPGVGGVSFGTPKSRALTSMLGEAAAEALAARADGLRAGFGQVPGWKGARAMGPMGVQALVVEAGGQRTAHVLLDGNNMHRGLRGTLRDRLLELVDEAELYTTDNHIVNVMVGGFNPVGMRDDRDRIERSVVQATEAALADLRDAEAAAAHVEVGDVLVFGSGNTIRLSSAINSAVATAKGALPAAFGLATAVAALAIYVLGYAI